MNSIKTASLSALLFGGLVMPLVAASPVEGLLHHWELNGDLLDSAGGADARPAPAAELAYDEGIAGGQALVLAGEAGLYTGRIDGLAEATQGARTVSLWLRNSDFPIPSGSSLINQSAFYAVGDDGPSMMLRWTWAGQDEANSASPGAARPQLWFWGVGGGSGQGIRGPLMEADTWKHFAVVADPLAADGSSIKIYVNGSPAEVFPGSVTIRNFDRLWFGSQSGNQRFMRGMMDDIRIYDRALSAEEVAALTAEASSPVEPVEVATPDRGITPDHAAHRLRYNNPGLVVDLGVGLWAVPLPMDYTGNGVMDLLVSTADTPSRGLYFFENDGSGVMREGRLVSNGVRRTNLGVSYLEDEVIVAEPGVAYRDFQKNLYGKPEPIDFKPDFFQDRFNQWKFVDYNGNGLLDLMIGVSDWRDYGWDDRHDEEGNWTGGPLHGHIYWVPNEGTNDEPVYREARQVLLEDGSPLSTYGAPSPNYVDWNGNGKMDFICGEFLDRLYFFENIGTREEPVYAPGRFLEVDGETLHLELQMLQVVVVDFTGNGRLDIVVGKEDGRVVLIENKGQGEDGMPVLAEPVYFRQRAENVKVGALATPAVYDWNGNGYPDLIVGNTAGFIEWVENLDGGDPPTWAAPRRLEADGEVIHIQAGPKMSIQGPAEAKWGYTVPYVADWNMNGLPDIIVNSIIGEIVWYENIGTRTEPKLAAAKPIKVEWPEGATPKVPWSWWDPEEGNLAVHWRTRPLALDVDGDGLIDLVVQDHEGYLSFFRRVREDGELRLLPGQRIFLGEDDSYVFGPIAEHRSFELEEGGPNYLHYREPDGSALFFYPIRGTRDVYLRSKHRRIDTVEEAANLVLSDQPDLLRLNAGWAGRSGRRKFDLVDWTGNGRLDLIVNSRNADLLENIGEEGEFRFRQHRQIIPHRLSGHTTNPIAVDFANSGVPSLLIGAEDGFLYYYPRTSHDEYTESLE